MMKFMIYSLASILIICIGVGISIKYIKILNRCSSKTEEVNESKGDKKNVILDPVRVKDKDNYPLYNRSLDTIQIGDNAYQINAIYIGCSGISVVKIRTFKK